MIILGLGSNSGDRLSHLRAALTALKKLAGITVLAVSPVYISEAQLPENAPLEWNREFLNFAIRCECSLTPFALLAALKKIEHEIGRELFYERWSPRVVDIDILVWGDEVIQAENLTIPHIHMLDRPFVLWPLADLVPLWLHPQQQLSAEQLAEPWGSRFLGTAPFRTRQINQRIETPKLVGIINVTPDSFSDGGQFTDVDQAVAQAIQLVKEGAEILDIGAESTAPHSPRIDSEMEWRRLEPVLAAITAAKNHFLIQPLVSVDTLHAEVAKRSLQYHVDWINDVTGFNDPAMRAVVRNANVDCVVMHHLTIPPSRDHVLPRDQDPVEFLYRWSENQIALLENEGIAKERIIIDPGFGFGKTPGQSLALLNGISRFANLGVRLLIGHSRKSFMTIFTACPAAERDIESLAIAEFLARHPVDYLRMHNVNMCGRAFRLQAILTSK
jgi:2-amino-4-hydroxy-6-hydroxymethyldihydropteridine diphosphokinase/dihydropteroate synthase